MATLKSKDESGSPWWTPFSDRMKASLSATLLSHFMNNKPVCPYANDNMRQHGWRSSLAYAALRTAARLIVLKALVMSILKHTKGLGVLSTGGSGGRRLA